MTTPYLILGSGYTGRRVAQALRQLGRTVLEFRTHAHHSTLPFDILDPTTHHHLTQAIQAHPSPRVLYSLPVLRAPHGYHPTAPVAAPLLEGAARVVYLSTTGVYGDLHHVDETTPPAPRHERESLRLEEERTLAAGPWSTLILRPAAIYGPGRGVHQSMLEGRYRLPGDGSNFISRIHVDDLAAHCLAALDSPLTGAFPVADAHPCPALDIAAFCSELLHVPMPEFTERLPGDDTRRANRQVDGSAIRRALSLTLRYPSYRQGIPASLSDAARPAPQPGFTQLS